MLSVVCLTMPFVICFMFTILFALRKNKTVTDRILLGLSVCAAVYFFAELNYLTLYEDYKTLVIADIASQFARPLVPPLMVLCLHSMTKRLVWRWWMTLAFALAIVIGSVSMCIYLIMGLDNAAMYVDKLDDAEGEVTVFESRIHWLYVVVCVWLYRVTDVVYAGVAIGRIVYLFKKTGFRYSEIPNFLFRKGELEPAFLMSVLYLIMLGSIFLKLMIGKYYLIEHQGVASVFCMTRTVLVFLIGHVGLRNGEASVSMESLRGSIGDVENHNAQEQNHITGGGKKVVNYVDMCDEDGMDVERFGEISERLLYLDPHITIEDVATKIGTNRTYLSRYITDTFGTTFREYINGLRIEYSKQYMLKHPKDKQEVVAEKCGFADAPQFNKKFKQIEGKSPRMWLMLQ